VKKSSVFMWPNRFASPPKSLGGNRKKREINHNTVKVTNHSVQVFPGCCERTPVKDCYFGGKRKSLKAIDWISPEQRKKPIGGPAGFILTQTHFCCKNGDPKNRGEEEKRKNQK